MAIAARWPEKMTRWQHGAWLRWVCYFARLCAAFRMLKSSGGWSLSCIGYGTLTSARLKSKVSARLPAGVPELVKGAGLKLRCIVLRGFKSLPLHQFYLNLVTQQPREPSTPGIDVLEIFTVAAIAESGSNMQSSNSLANCSSRPNLSPWITFSIDSCKYS